MSGGSSGRYDAYVFDLDGTIYLGDELLPGAVEVVERLRDEGIPVRFLSNNATRDPQQYADKLAGLGLRVDAADIVNTVVTTTRWLAANHPGARVFPIAEEPLCRSLEAAGLRLCEDPALIDVVVASYDRGFDYRKLQIAFDALWFHRRAVLIQTNPDLFCPFPGGRGEPDCAAITAAIEACTQVRCSVSLGKPSPLMLDAALEGLEVDRSRVVMVGDRPATDIAMGVAAGCETVLVLTGEASAADVSGLSAEQRPTHVIDGVAALLGVGPGSAAS